MDNQSKHVFSSNLYYMMNRFDLETFDNLANHLGKKRSAVKAWVYKHSLPTLGTLDQIGNYLQIEAYRLLKPTFGEKDLKTLHGLNDSKRVFQINFKAFIIDQFKIELKPEKVVRELKTLSREQIVSYLRKRNSNSPSIQTLDKIANHLHIHSFELIKPKEEKR